MIQSQIVLKCLYLLRIGRLDILWTVNKLARSVTKWTQACDKRFARLISKIHHTNGHRQYCHVGNTSPHCRLGLFQDSDFAGDLEDSNLSEICTVILWQDCYAEGNLRKSYSSMAGRKFQIGIVSLYTVKKGLFLSVYVDDIKLKVGWMVSPHLIHGI